MNNAGRIQRGVAWLAAHVTSALPLTLVFGLACLGGGPWADHLGASGLLAWLLTVIGAGITLSAISFVAYLVVIRADLMVPRVRVVTRERLVRRSPRTPPCDTTQQGHARR